MENLKKTPLFDIHKDLGAKMVPFAGYEMPIEYSGVIKEHKTVRQYAGVFDVSHMGEFLVSGPGAFELVQQLTTNDVSRLTNGRAQYSCLPNGKGGIIDDLIIYRIGEDRFLLVVNAANIEKDWNWINDHKKSNVKLENISDQMSLIAVQGPKATGILQKLTNTNLSEIKFYHFVTGEIAGIPDMIISATGYTGAGGFELYVPNKYAGRLWKRIFEVGGDQNLKPAGLAARDTLRLEMGFCLYGNDIDDTTSPIEAKLGWITKFTDGNNFIDRELFWKQKQEGVKRKLVGFELVDKGIPRQHYEITDENGETIGRVTSGTMSPMMKKGIGLGYVAKEYAKEGTEIFIKIRSRRLKAMVVKLPIYKE